MVSLSNHGRLERASFDKLRMSGRQAQGEQADERRDFPIVLRVNWDGLDYLMGCSQFSIIMPGILPKWRVLPVTTMNPLLRAMAPMRRSDSCRGVPALSSSALACANRRAAASSKGNIPSTSWMIVSIRASSPLPSCPKRRAPKSSSANVMLEMCFCSVGIETNLAKRSGDGRLAVKPLIVSVSSRYISPRKLNVRGWTSKSCQPSPCNPHLSNHRR